MAIHSFLTLNTKRGPWNGAQSLCVDWLFAVFAHSKGAFAEAAQGRADRAQLLGFAINLTDGERTFSSTLDFVDWIRTLLDGNVIA